MFLWLDIVIRDVADSVRNDDILLKLEKRVDILPDSIDGLYKHMLGKLNKLYLEEAGQYFRVLAAASFDGALCNLLSFACMEKQSWKHSLQNDRTYFTSNSFLQHCDALATRIITRCAGLVEIEEPQNKDIDIYQYIYLKNGEASVKELPLKESGLTSQWRIVSFIHRSAADFVRQYYTEIFKSANLYSIGNLEHARGMIGFLALLPMLLAPEYIQQWLQVNDRITVTVWKSVENIAFSLHAADEHSRSERTIQDIANEMLKMTERLYDVLSHMEEDLQNLISPTETKQNISLIIPYLNLKFQFHDGAGLASYFGLRSAVLLQLTSVDHDPAYLNYLLTCVTAGSGAWGDIRSDFDIVEALLDLGADTSVQVCTQYLPDRIFLKTEQSAWAHFLRASLYRRNSEDISRFCRLLPRLFCGLSGNTSIMPGKFGYTAKGSAGREDPIDSMSSERPLLSEFRGSFSVISEESGLSHLKHMQAVYGTKISEELEGLVRSLSPLERTRHRLLSFAPGIFYELNDDQSKRMSEAWLTSWKEPDRDDRPLRIDVQGIIAELTETNKIDPETFVLRPTF